MEKRSRTRYSVKPSVRASFNSLDIENEKICNVSNKNIAFKCNGNNNFSKGDVGKLILFLGNSNQQTETIATVFSVRDAGNCVILLFDTEKDISEYIERHDNKRERQKELASIELPLLSNEVVQLKECQFKLFLTFFTISIALASLLVILKSKNFSSNIIVFVVIGPALVSTIFTLVSFQKALALNRITSYLLILKQKIIEGELPERYLGWQDSLNNSYSCHSMDCHTSLRCDKVADNDAQGAQNKLRSQVHYYLFSAIIYSTYIAIFLMSVGGTIYFMYHRRLVGDFSLGIIITCIIVIVLLLAVLIAYFGYQVQSGKYSFAKYFCLWRVMLKECEAYDPNRIRT